MSCMSVIFTDCYFAVQEKTDFFSIIKYVELVDQPPEWDLLQSIVLSMLESSEAEEQITSFVWGQLKSATSHNEHLVAL